MVDHDAFIDSLSHEAAPVKRPLSPAMRAFVWITLALPLGGLVGWNLSRAFADWSVPGAIWGVIGLLSAFGLGAAAMFSAFSLSIAGRKPVGWQWFAASAAVWLAAGVVSVVNASDPWGHPGSGSGCYIFMVTVSLPMIVLAIAGLARTRTLYPVRTLGVAGLGIACMTAVLLSLCHPPTGDLPDFLMHMVAAATIVVVTVGLGRRFVAV